MEMNTIENYKLSIFKTTAQVTPKNFVLFVGLILILIN